MTPDLQKAERTARSADGCPTVACACPRVKGWVLGVVLVLGADVVEGGLYGKLEGAAGQGADGLARLPGFVGGWAVGAEGSGEGVALSAGGLDIVHGPGARVAGEGRVVVCSVGDLTDASLNRSIVRRIVRRGQEVSHALASK